MSRPSGPVPGQRPEPSGAMPPPPTAAPPGPLRQLIQAQAGNAQGDATAYLRGAAHLDPAFRDAVIEELVENPHRIPPPSFGVDLVAILKECFAARRWAVQRGLLMLGLPLLLLPVDVWGALALPLTVLSVRWSLFLARVLVRLLERAAARIGVSGSARAVRLLGALVWLWTMLAVAWTVGGTALALVAAGFSGDSSHSSQRCAYDYGAERYSCTGADGPGHATLWVALLVFAAWTAVAAVDRYRRLVTLHRLGTGRAPMPADEGARAARYRRLRQQQADPDVVYSDYAPFVGAGVEVDHWSFAIELVPDAPAATDLLAKQPTPPAAPAVLTAPAVHARLRTDLLRLGETGTPPHPGDRLHGIRVIDYVFKRGLRLGPAGDWSGTGPDSAFARVAPHAMRDAAWQLQPGRPGDSGDSGGQPPVPPQTWWVDSLDLAAEERLRHYLAVRVDSWGGELVLTVFTRVQLQGGLLFLENRAFLLPPIARAHHAIDTAMPPADAGDWIGLVWRSLGSALVLPGRAVPDLFRTVRTAVRTARREAWYERMCRADRPVDHGPAYSVRELGAEPEFQQLFQEMDVLRFLKSIETRTLTSVRNCLREHGYRTDEYDARQSVVINNGVQVGGNVTGNVQSGAHARATYQQVQAPQPRIGTSKG
ncbi:hypothetical protein [Peterkaempfera bronchialis]|nr:hypothetical protein [Peterkaempfera bronchialis]